MVRWRSTTKGLPDACKPVLMDLRSQAKKEGDRKRSLFLFHMLPTNAAANYPAAIVDNPNAANTFGRCSGLGLPKRLAA